MFFSEKNGKNTNDARLMRFGDFSSQNTVYDGEYHANHPNIVTFWQVFENLTEEEKKKFYCKWQLAVAYFWAEQRAGLCHLPSG